ncbi:vWA domain-containing protein [Nocardia abscessus]|uniref:vWA domain-containing protein n=1 Tax=Nocardia abscessus TaxID=120957 RepID=UPI0024561AE3|nr:VWA domain-containing protein [Nocardia abscessus]
MPRFTQLIAVLTACLIGAALAAPGAAAQPDRTEQPPRYAPTMLILDASGSMQRPDPAGTMMDAAKNAVRAFVAAAPAESKVGLVTYGTGTGNAEADKAAGCRDVHLLRRADPLDKAALTTAVDGIQARGWTPMGPALRQAADAMPGPGPRSIVLVSDGEDTCAPPDACEIAREVKQRGIDLVVHAIGFAVDPAARNQLTCMAQATGGTYTDAADGRALERVLPRVSAAALRNYRAAGIPITGTGSHDTAPVAAPGQYLDTIGRQEKRYWSVDVPAGATAYFSGTVSFPRVRDVSVTEDLNTLQLRVYGADGQDCHAFESELTTKSSDGAALTIAKTWDGATKERSGSASGDKCRGGGRYSFAVTWDKVSAGVPERLPVELLVGIEPGVTDPGPAATTTPTAFTEPTGSGTPVTGGGSFNVAAPLPGSGRYTDILWQGEFVFYRVRLDWGQGLAYRVHYGGNGGRGLDNISNIRTTLYSPIRQEIESDFSAYTGTDTVLPTKDARATVPVRYANRTADDIKARRQSVPGWYYIAVKVGSTFEQGDAAPVPIRLDLTVTGGREPGPTYSSGVADGVFGEKADTQRVTQRTDAVAAAGAATESRNEWLLVAGLGAIAVVVVGVIAGVLVLRRRG